MSGEIPLRAVEPPAQPAHQHYDAPYQAFIAASLVLAIGGGFMLAILVPHAHAESSDLGGRVIGLQQAHGQLQLLGFAGLFTMGMSMRLMPRFSGRPLPWPPLIRSIVPLMASGLLLRWLAQSLGDGAWPAALAVVSAGLALAAAAAFAAIVWRMLLHPGSRGEATGWFFSLGALALLASALLNAWIIIDAAPDVSVLPFARMQALNSLAQYGFVMLFIGGVSTRAVPALTGHRRRDLASRAAATTLAVGASLLTFGLLWAERDGVSTANARVADSGMIVIALAFVAIVALTGVFQPVANRVAAASQAQFWFVRAGMAWLLVAAVMLAWYGGGAFAGGELADVFEMDAVRHAVGVGVITNMIVGMAMLVVPEFAGRRLQHPNERWLVVGMLVVVNVAAVLRVWPAVEGVEWLEATRWWPMATAGGFAEAALIAFAFMFAQSWWEQRRPGWASAEALAARRGPA